MKLIFNLFILLNVSNLFGNEMFHITYGNNMQKALEIKKVMFEYLHIPPKHVLLKKMRNACEHSAQSKFQICVFDDGNFKVYDWSGNEFRATKPLVQNLKIDEKISRNLNEK